MSSTEKYEPIKFDSWQELAKYVIDGGEVYVDCQWRIRFSGVGFNCDIKIIFSSKNLYIKKKKQPTLEELIAIKPRLILAWDTSESEGVLKLIKDPRSLTSLLINWNNFRMLTDDEIKQFLDKEPS